MTTVIRATFIKHFICAGRQNAVFLLILPASLGGRGASPHCSDEKVEAQREKTVGPKSYLERRRVRL